MNQSARPNTAFKRVLLLEDDKDFSMILDAFLESEGFKVTQVANGVEGLKQVMGADFDLILCDMLMPNLAGDMFYTAVERTKPHLCKRFIFMTGHRGDPKWDAFARKVGPVMLFKPFELHILLESVFSILRKTQPPPER